MSGELVYLVYPEARIAEDLASRLHQGGFKVISLRSDAEAEDAVSHFKYVLPDVLITPLDDPESGDSVLFRLLAANPLMEQVPVVILASGESGQRRQALRMGLDNLVFPPYDTEELILSTRLAIDRQRDDSRLFGSLSQLSVPELFQTVEVGRRSGVIVMRNAGKTGTVWMRDGHVVRGDIDDGRSGEAALFGMISWKDGIFEADFTQVPPEGDFRLLPSAVLLEAMRLEDEARRDTERAATETREDYDTVKVPSAGEGNGRGQDVVEKQLRPSDRKGTGSSDKARDALIVHSALLFVNLFVSYALSAVAPGILRQRMEALRQRLEMDYPELRIFRLTPDCHVILDLEITLVLSGEGVMKAVAWWLDEIAATLERAMPGRFGPEKMNELRAPARGGENDPEFFLLLQTRGGRS